MTMTELEEEIERAKKHILNYCDHINDTEENAPIELKLLMLMNDWHSPFIVLQELQKRVETNIMLLKKQGVKVKYNAMAVNTLIRDKGGKDCGSCKHHFTKGFKSTDCDKYCFGAYECYERVTEI